MRRLIFMISICVLPNLALAETPQTPKGTSVVSPVTSESIKALAGLSGDRLTLGVAAILKSDPSPASVLALSRFAASLPATDGTTIGAEIAGFVKNAVLTKSASASALASAAIQGGSAQVTASVANVLVQGSVANPEILTSVANAVGSSAQSKSFATILAQSVVGFGPEEAKAASAAVAAALSGASAYSSAIAKAVVDVAVANPKVAAAVVSGIGTAPKANQSVYALALSRATVESGSNDVAAAVSAAVSASGATFVQQKVAENVEAAKVQTGATTPVTTLPVLPASTLTPTAPITSNSPI